jgi:hypothetical protein
LTEPEKLDLRETHRRILSALLRGFEDMRAEIGPWIDPAPGILVAVEDRLGAAERRALRSLLGELEEEIRRLDREISLDVSSRSAARTIGALLVEHLSLLEETAGGELRGYGAIDPALHARLDSEFARLRDLFSRMLAVVRRDSGER